MASGFPPSTPIANAKVVGRPSVAQPMVIQPPQTPQHHGAGYTKFFSKAAGGVLVVQPTGTMAARVPAASPPPAAIVQQHQQQQQHRNSPPTVASAYRSKPTPPAALVASSQQQQQQQQHRALVVGNQPPRAIVVGPQQRSSPPPQQQHSSPPSATAIIVAQPQQPSPLPLPQPSTVASTSPTAVFSPPPVIPARHQTATGAHRPRVAIAIAPQQQQQQPQQAISVLVPQSVAAASTPLDSEQRRLMDNPPTMPQSGSAPPTAEQTAQPTMTEQRQQQQKQRASLPDVQLQMDALATELQKLRAESEALRRQLQEREGAVSNLRMKLNAMEATTEAEKTEIRLQMEKAHGKHSEEQEKRLSQVSMEKKGLETQLAFKEKEILDLRSEKDRLEILAKATQNQTQSMPPSNAPLSAMQPPAPPQVISAAYGKRVMAATDEGLQKKRRSLGDVDNSAAPQQQRTVAAPQRQGKISAARSVMAKKLLRICSASSLRPRSTCTGSIDFSSFLACVIDGSLSCGSLLPMLDNFISLCEVSERGIAESALLTTEVLIETCKHCKDAVLRPLLASNGDVQTGGGAASMQLQQQRPPMSQRIRRSAVPQTPVLRFCEKDSAEQQQRNASSHPTSQLLLHALGIADRIAATEKATASLLRISNEVLADCDWPLVLRFEPLLGKGVLRSALFPRPKSAFLAELVIDTVTHLLRAFKVRTAYRRKDSSADSRTILDHIAWLVGMDSCRSLPRSTAIKAVRMFLVAVGCRVPSYAAERPSPTAPSGVDSRMHDMLELDLMQLQEMVILLLDRELDCILTDARVQPQKLQEEMCLIRDASDLLFFFTSEDDPAMDVSNFQQFSSIAYKLVGLASIVPECHDIQFRAEKIGSVNAGSQLSQLPSASLQQQTSGQLPSR